MLSAAPGGLSQGSVGRVFCGLVKGGGHAVFFDGQDVRWGVLSSAPLCAARRGGLHPGMMHNAVETKTVGIAAGRLSAGLQCLE